jgi:hypothetical protein
MNYDGEPSFVLELGSMLNVVGKQIDGYLAEIKNALISYN